ncbi:type ISP restriction/modification enzyme [Segatella copri]|uniref:type ISP restriction/modification enzyme n=1 Tax=Segatella copri TaxID=165179 RepID=UPI003D03E559
MLIVWLKRAESPKALSPGRIYAILHFSNYRKKFKEQLKYQFPRIPYPQNEEE